MNIGVVIGRFQTYELHKAHVELLHFARNENDRLVVFIGVSPVDGHTAEHPLTYSQRYNVVETMAPPSTLVLPLFNKSSNEQWTRMLDDILLSLFPRDTVRLYGGRDSFIPHYTGKLSTVVFAPAPERSDSATEQRSAITESNRSDFMQGQIYALQSQFPHAYPTVDIAVLKDDDVLLIQRADTGEWGLPGGFVDPTDESLEKAAARELLEETGLSIETKPNYVGSVKVKDWRYRNTRDGIITSLFAAPYSFGNIRLNPEEARDHRWYNLRRGNSAIAVSQAHVPLISMLVAESEKKARKLVMKGIQDV